MSAAPAAPPPHPDPTAPADRRPPGPLLPMVAPIVLALALLVLYALASASVLMGLRSLGHGENLWVQNQKRSTFTLLQHLQTGDARALAHHDAAMRHFEAFHRGRQALASGRWDDAVLMRDFLAAGVPQRDVERALPLFRWGHVNPWIQRQLEAWAAADALMLKLVPLRAEVLRARAVGDTRRLAVLAREIGEVDEQVAPLARAFSSAVAEGAELTHRLLAWGAALLGLALAAAVAWRLRGLWLAQRRAQLELEGERARAEATLASIGDAVLTIDGHRRVTYMNAAARTLTGASPVLGGRGAGGVPVDEVLALSDLNTGEAADPVAQALGAPAGHPINGPGQPMLRRADGQELPVSWVASALQEPGQPAGAVLVLRDTTRERQLVHRLSWLASHDALTQLPNRREFEDRLARLLQRAEDEGLPSVLMLLDLDQFKIVNDTSGHAAGDELLRLVASHLRSQLRAQDTLARMGGDEFGVLLEGCEPGPGERKAAELLAAIRAVELHAGGQRFRTSGSIGVLHIGRGHGGLAEALSAADMACYVAKQSGRDRIVVHQPDDARLAAHQGEMGWPQRLRQAMVDGRLHLVAQPIVGIQPSTQHERHEELLLRLVDETGRVVTPAQFLPAAERYGLMPSIDRWVVRTALAGIAERLQGPEPSAVRRWSINLSGASLGDPGLIDWIEQVFEEHRVPFHRVLFELTETQAVADIDAAVLLMKRLRARGLRFALDDFGAGLSSMGLLRRLPVDVLKIDGAIVLGMANDRINRALVEMAARLGRTLGLRTVGEFVEDDATLQALREAGVDHAQGWAIGRPQPFGRAAAALPDRLAAVQAAAPITAPASTPR